MARKQGAAPSEHARTHADLSGASPRAAGPAPSCREAPGGGLGKARFGWRLGGVAWGLKPWVRLPPGCDLAAEPLLECGNPSHGNCDAATHPRASRVGGRKPRCSPCPRAQPGTLGPSHSPTVWPPAPPRLAAPIPPPPPGHAEPYAVSRATVTSHCSRGQSVTVERGGSASGDPFPAFTGWK